MTTDTTVSAWRRGASDRQLSRRVLLRGFGAALGVPWLEAMLPTSNAFGAETAKQEPPVRLAVLWSPNGVHQDHWTPRGEGSDFELSPSLQHLAEFKDKLFIPTNLWNQASNIGDGHYVKCSGFLTCTTINKSLGIDLNCNGRSMDQVAADLHRQQTPLPSLELGIDPVTTGVDTNVGYTRVYGSHIAWSGPTNPLAKELNPALLFDRLFRCSNSDQKTHRNDKLLLDRVLEDARELNGKLGNSDRHRMDEYLQSLRSIEERLARAATQSQTWTPRAAFDRALRPDAEIPEMVTEHVQLMLDMIALAFQTDTTRVATFMFGNAVSNRNFSFIDGVSSGHHEVSHHQKQEDKLKQYQLITEWHVQQYRYLLRKLDGMQEGDGSVLDNAMVLYGSGLRDGDSHNPHDLPIVLAGKAGGKLATGRHQTYSRDTPLSNLYVSMLQALGSPADNFADSTGPLAGVLA